MKRLSRTRLFLLEMLVNLLVFVIGAAICILTLSEAYSLSASSRVLTKAHMEVENAAMAIRSTNGDISPLTDILNGSLKSSNELIVWYDKNWNAVSSKDGIYSMSIKTKQEESNIVKSKIVVYEPNGDIITQLSTSQYRPKE